MNAIRDIWSKLRPYRFGIGLLALYFGYTALMWNDPETKLARILRDSDSDFASISTLLGGDDHSLIAGDLPDDWKFEDIALFFGLQERDSGPELPLTSNWASYVQPWWNPPDHFEDIYYKSGDQDTTIVARSGKRVYYYFVSW